MENNSINFNSATHYPLLPQPTHTSQKRKLPDSVLLLRDVNTLINGTLLDTIIKTKEVEPLRQILDTQKTYPLTPSEGQKILSIRDDPQINTFEITLATTLNPNEKGEVKKSISKVFVNLKILSWSSNFFKKVFDAFNDKMEIDEKVEIDDTEMPDFPKMAINFCYGVPICELKPKGKLKSFELLQLTQLLKAAVFLEMPELIKQIENLLLSQIDTIPLQYLLIFYEHASSTKNENLINSALNKLLDWSIKFPLFSTPKHRLTEFSLDTIKILQEKLHRLTLNFSDLKELLKFYSTVQHCPLLESITLLNCESILAEDLCKICWMLRGLKSLKELTIDNYKISTRLDFSNIEIYNDEPVGIDDIFQSLSECHALQTLELSGGKFYELDSLMDRTGWIIKGSMDLQRKFTSLTKLVLKLSVPFTLDYVIGSMVIFPSLSRIEYTNENPLSQEIFKTYEKQYNLSVERLNSNEMLISLSKEKVERSIVLRYLGKRNAAT